MKEEKSEQDFMEKNIETSIKLTNEGLKIAYDYYKYFATFITGSLFIIVILYEKVFQNPEKVGIVIISIALLVLSLILLLLTLAIYRDYFAIIARGYLVVFSNESTEKSMESVNGINKKLHSMGKTEKILTTTTQFTFISGLIALAIFVCFNLVN